QSSVRWAASGISCQESDAGFDHPAREEKNLAHLKPAITIANVAWLLGQIKRSLSFRGQDQFHRPTSVEVIGGLRISRAELTPKGLAIQQPARGHVGSQRHAAG